MNNKYKDESESSLSSNCSKLSPGSSSINPNAPPCYEMLKSYEETQSNVSIYPISTDLFPNASEHKPKISGKISSLQEQLAASLSQQIPHSLQPLPQHLYPIDRLLVNSEPAIMNQKNGQDLRHQETAVHNATVSQIPKFSPTLIPAEPFNPMNDAEKLHNALQKWRADIESIIQVLTNRTNLQRLKIAIEFKTLYSKSLLQRLSSKTSGHIQQLLVAMLTPVPLYYANELHSAMSGFSVNKNMLIEVLCTMSNNEINAIKEAYITRQGKSLESDIKNAVSKEFKDFMVSLCSANRDESFEIDPVEADHDVEQLVKAVGFFKNKQIFKSILVKRNTGQLKLILEKYRNKTGHDIKQAIKNEFHGSYKKALLAIVTCVENKADFFAEKIYESVKGYEARDQDLIRLIVTRSEVDMREIKEVFSRQYEIPLEYFIKDTCSGLGRKCLITLISV